MTANPHSTDIVALRSTEANSLRNAVPEFFEGRLPAELQRRFDTAFGPEAVFAIGVNQSIDEDTAGETAKALDAAGGIPLHYTDFSSQYQLFDSTEAWGRAEVALTGFYGPKVGRNIVVFPVPRSDAMSPGQIVRDMQQSRQALPADFILEVSSPAGQPEERVNSKYIAGYADQGVFYVNNSFLIEEPVQFEAFEAGRAQELGDIGKIALGKVDIQAPSITMLSEAFDGSFLGPDADDGDLDWM